MACIKDEELFNILEQHAEDILVSKFQVCTPCRCILYTEHRLACCCFQPLNSSPLNIAWPAAAFNSSTPVEKHNQSYQNIVVNTA